MQSILLLSVLLFAGRSSADLHKKQELHFSNTQKWFDYAEKVLKRDSYILEMDNSELAVIKPPPAQDSKETKFDLNQLVNHQFARTSKDIEQITSELGFCGWNMAGYQLGSNPELDDKLIKILYDVSKIGFRLKQKFDRVRPSFLDNRILPAIAVPEHAAYPSNHSLESHLLALILADLFPDMKEKFWQSADSITKNREIAGVHYASDSAAGRQVAKLAFKKLKKSKKYNEFINNSKKSTTIVYNHQNSTLNCRQLVKDSVPK